MSEITTAEELDALPVGSVVMYVLRSEPDAPSVACRAVRGWQFLGDDPERRYLSQSLAPTETPLTVLYRPDAPTLSDAARLHSGIEALADEWEAKADKHRVLAARSTWELLTKFHDAHAKACRDHAAALRALLSADDEAVE